MDIEPIVAYVGMPIMLVVISVVVAALLIDDHARFHSVSRVMGGASRLVIAVGGGIIVLGLSLAYGRLWWVFLAWLLGGNQ